MNWNVILPYFIEIFCSEVASMTLTSLLSSSSSSSSYFMLAVTEASALIEGIRSWTCSMPSFMAFRLKDVPVSPRAQDHECNVILWGFIIDFLLGTANQGELRNVLVYKVKIDWVSSFAPGVSINNTQPKSSLHVVVGDLDVGCDDILPSVIFQDRSGFSGLCTCFQPTQWMYLGSSLNCQ